MDCNSQSIKTLAPGDGELLFDRILHGQIQGDQHRRASLRVTIRSSATSLRAFAKDIDVYIVDDNDPFFFYRTRINEEDFHLLKTQQSLLVDFAAFPQQLIDLLQSCQHDDTTEGKFGLELRMETQFTTPKGERRAFLEIVEIRPYRRLVLLSLQLKAADEDFLKKHLISTMLRLRMDNSRMESAIRSAESDCEKKLELSQRNIDAYVREIERLKNEHHVQLQRLSRENEQMLKNAQDSYGKKQAESEATYQRELRAAEEHWQHRVEQLASQLSAAESIRRDLQDRLDTKDHTLKTTERQLSETRIALQRAQAHLDDVERETHDRDRDVAQLRQRIAALERNATESDAIAAKTQELLVAAQEQKRHLEDLLEQKRGQLIRREDAVKTLSADVNKANQIIQRLQDEITSLQAKLVFRGQVIAKQERVISEREEAFKAAAQQRNGSDLNGNFTSAQITKLRAEIEEKNRKIANLEKDVHGKDSVIQWLNKRIDEQQCHNVASQLLATTGTTTPAGTPSSGVGTGTSPLSNPTQSTPVATDPMGRMTTAEALGMKPRRDGFIDEEYLRPTRVQR